MTSCLLNSFSKLLVISCSSFYWFRYLFLSLELSKTYLCGGVSPNGSIFSVLLKVKVKFIQWCLTFCDPMDYTIHGLLQARILEWVAFPFSTGSSQPRHQTQISCIRWILYQLSHKGNPKQVLILLFSLTPILPFFLLLVCLFLSSSFLNNDIISSSVRPVFCFHNLLECFSSWVHKELDMTQWLNWTELWKFLDKRLCLLP